MRHKDSKRLSIGVFIRPNSRSIKAIRDKISGALRHAAEHPEWAVRILELPDGGRLGDEKLDGAIFLAGLPPHPERIARSHVAVDPEPRRKGTIVIDDAEIAATAARFLMKRGYRSLAFVGSARPSLASHSRARRDAFLAAAAAAGARTATLEVDESYTGFAAGLERIAEFVSGLEKPCGLMACADEIAKDVLDACHIAHVTVPDQLALIGVDNEIEICENMQPSLTSVHPDFERSGYMASRILARAIRDGQRHPSGLYIYGTKTIVERSSTLDLKGGGRLVAAAVEIIRRNSRQGLTVADLARRLNASPRLVEMRFREVLGRTVKDSILEVRLEKVQELLTSSSCPIEKIAAECGWRTSIALKALFKRRFGVSMRDYRRRKTVRQ